MPYTATAKISTLTLGTPVGDDTLVGSVDASGATRRFKVSDVVALAAGGVSSVNGATGAVSIDADSVTAVGSINGLSGTITLAAGDNVTVSTAGSTITIAAAAGGGGGGIVSVNGYTATAVSLSATDITAASATHASQHQTGGSDVILPVVTAVSITASVNDYSLPTGDIYRISHGTTNTVEITGLATAVDGAAKLLINVSTGSSSTYTIKHADTNSTAVSQFAVPWAGDYVLSPNGGAALVIYDDTDERWRVV